MRDVSSNKQGEEWRGHRRVLLLAHRFPPLNESGSVRTRNLAKYLSRLGWDVTVVTPRPSLWRECNRLDETNRLVESEGIRRILTGHHLKLLSPDQFKTGRSRQQWLLGGILRRVARGLSKDSAWGWLRPARKACSFLRQGDVDIIVVSGQPFSSFLLAEELADKLSCPFVLDYRDPWTGNPHVAKFESKRIRKTEERLFSKAAAVTVVSPSWATLLESNFGPTSKVNFVPNGFDPEEFKGVKPREFDHFAIVYTGTFYPPKRVITPVFLALKRLHKPQDSNWVFHYFGNHEQHVEQEATRFGIGKNVKIHGKVPRKDVLSAVAGAKLNVVITTVESSIQTADRGIIPGKLFESLGLAKPILLLAPPDSDAARLFEKGGLVHRFSGDDVTSMSDFIRNLIREPRPNRAEPLNAYSWVSLGKSFDAILRTTLQGR